MAYSRVQHYTQSFPELGIPFVNLLEYEFARAAYQHSHVELQILLILDGSAVFEWKESRIVLREGDICFIPPLEKHTVVADRPGARTLLIDLRIVQQGSGPLYPLAFSMTQKCIWKMPGSKLRLLARELQKSLFLKGSAKTAYLMSALWKIFSELTRDSEIDDYFSTEKNRHLAAAERYMFHELSEPIGVNQVAAAIGISRSQLTRLYLKRFRTSPAIRLRTLRVNKAKELLETSTLSVKEIARVCGFKCQNHFARVFRNETGSSPLNYRQKSK